MSEKGKAKIVDLDDAKIAIEEEASQSDKEKTCPKGEEGCTCCHGEDHSEGHMGGDSDSDFGPPGMMFDCMASMFQQQQGAMANVLAMFLTHDGKNVCQHFGEIKKAIDTNSRCILKLNETLSLLASKK